MDNQKQWDSDWTILGEYITKKGALLRGRSLTVLEQIYKDVQALYKKEKCYRTNPTKNILLQEQIQTCCRLTSKEQIQKVTEEWELNQAKDALLRIICQNEYNGYDEIKRFWEYISAEDDQEDSILMKNNDEFGFGLGAGIRKDEIKTIVFIGELADAPREAWDVSEKKNRSVLAWVKGKKGIYELYIAGKGKVTANRDCGSLFSGYTNLEQIKGMEIFDTSRTTNMRWMFFGCRNLKKIDVSRFDTSQVTDMWNMFYECRALNELDVRGFDTGQVTNMWCMFWECENLTKLDVSGFNTSRVSKMSSMFHGCRKLEKLDVSRFDTRQVQSMEHMFFDCKKLTDLDVSGFDTSHVTNMWGMFAGCEALKALDVSGFDTGRVWNMRQMFYGCTNLKKLDISRFDMSQVTDMREMFS